MKLIPVALAVFFRTTPDGALEVWTQRREDDGPFHGLLEFPGGGVESGETSLQAAVREVREEVGIDIQAELGTFMGNYPRHLEDKTIVLSVHLFPPVPELEARGQWLKVEQQRLSLPHEGKIPYPNHRIIDDLYLSLFGKNA